MAKGSKKKKAGSKLQSAPVADTKKKATKAVEAHPYVKRVQLAYELGNHAAVRALATNAPGEELDERALAQVNEAFEKTKTDPLVIAVGVGALLLALIVALATLGG